MEFLFITGMSGAGKTETIKIMEDMGYYCMENIPPALLPGFIEFSKKNDASLTKIAVVLNLRGRGYFQDFFKMIEYLRSNNIFFKILFLESSNEVLISRYKARRRPHPLIENIGIEEGIKEERKDLEDIKENSDFIIDTSRMKIKDLKEEIINILSSSTSLKKISISLVSFGFKHGTLLDADLIFDVRFLRNPYYIEKLKNRTGEDQDVKDYVLQEKEANTFIDKTSEYLEFLIPKYMEEGRPQLIIGIGCTGGVHRSVVISEEICKRLNKSGYNTIVRGRDIRLK